MVMKSEKVESFPLDSNIYWVISFSIRKKRGPISLLEEEINQSFSSDEPILVSSN